MKRKGWPVLPLGEVCQVNPRIGAEAPTPETLVSFVPMAAVDEQRGVIAEQETRAYREVARGYTYFRDNDVLFAKITPCMENGKAAIAHGLTSGIGFGSTEFHVLRPNAAVLPEWIFAFIRQPSFRVIAKANFTGTAGQQRVPTDFMKTVAIPLPPLDEQHRIVRILDEAESLRQLRARADERMAEFIPALFNQMFGDPATNRTIMAVPLGECVDILSGATPSKDEPTFWNGAIPWVSPKDMKPSEIQDSEDHITEAAFQKTNLKLIPANSILVVVRGMILVHTVPIRLNVVPVAINQDIKALIPHNNVESAYLQWVLQAQHSQILSQVSTAGHGTKRLDTEHLLANKIPLPPLAQQRDFAARVAEARALQDQQARSRDRLEAGFQALLHRAFAGEL